MKRLHLNKISSALVFALMLSASLTMISCSESSEDPIPANNNNDPDQMIPDEVGEAAPDFSLTALDGSTVKRSDFEDKVVVLFFMGSSCSLCRAVAPSVESELFETYKGNTSFALLGLDTWDGTNSALQSFKNTTGVTFPLLLDASAVAADYETTYDRLVVIDKNGNVAHKGTRATTNDIATVKTMVQELLNDGM